MNVTLHPHIPSIKPAVNHKNSAHLLLTPAELATTVPDFGAIALGEFHDEFVSVCLAGALFVVDT